MLFSLLYMVLRVVFRLAPSREERDREVEILVLRHQVTVLKRKAARPKFASFTDQTNEEAWDLLRRAPVPVLQSAH
jgi:hypothetical protein